MQAKDNSIGAHIDQLAREFGAPPSFVRRIRTLFSSKGISLDDESTPYRSALEEAFRREQSIRHNARQTQENLKQLHQQLLQFNEVFRKQLTRLRNLRDTLEPTATAAAAPGSSATPRPRSGKVRRVLIVQNKGGRLSVQEQEGKGVLVPGPKDLQ